MLWEDNEYHESGVSENHDDYEIDTKYAFTIYNHHMLPRWLQEKKEMIFLQRNIEKGELLGSGQFGVVFKGTLTLGNAVYVIIFDH